MSNELNGNVKYFSCAHLHLLSQFDPIHIPSGVGFVDFNNHQKLISLEQANQLYKYHDESDQCADGHLAKL